MTAIIFILLDLLIGDSYAFRQLHLSDPLALTVILYPVADSNRLHCDLSRPTYPFSARSSTNSWLYFCLLYATQSCILLCESSSVRKKVLIVDDEPGIRYIISRFFDSLDCDHESAASAEEALAMANQKRYDLIVSDYDLPGMNGCELAAIVRSASADTVLVLMSGRFQSLEKPSAVDLWLQKPFSFEGPGQGAREISAGRQGSSFR